MVDKNKPYRNFLLDILDTWALLNREIPQKVEDAKQKEEDELERVRKLALPSSRIENFSDNEIAIINELVQDSRRSYLDLSNNLGVSRRTVKKRIEVMVNQEKIQFGIGVNYQKLNLDFLILNITPINVKGLREIVEELQNCPRVFWIIKDISRNNLEILFGIEKSLDFSNQYINTIEKLQLDERVKECNVGSLNPEVLPKFLFFLPKNLPQPGMKTPCGSNCNICEKFIHNKCTGCPGSSAYRGELFKIIE